MTSSLNVSPTRQATKDPVAIICARVTSSSGEIGVRLNCLVRSRSFKPAYAAKASGAAGRVRQVVAEDPCLGRRMFGAYYRLWMKGLGSDWWPLELDTRAADQELHGFGQTIDPFYEVDNPTFRGPRDALGAALVRDLISEEHYEALVGPLATVLGRSWE